MWSGDVELRGAGYANSKWEWKIQGIDLNNEISRDLYSKIEQYERQYSSTYGPKLTLTPHPHLLKQGDSKGQRRGSLFALLKMQRLF